MPSSGAARVLTRSTRSSKRKPRHAGGVLSESLGRLVCLAAARESKTGEANAEKGECGGFGHCSSGELSPNFSSGERRIVDICVRLARFEPGNESARGNACQIRH